MTIIFVVIFKLPPEYKAGFRILIERIGFWSTLKIGLVAFIKSSKTHFKTDKGADNAEKTKVKLKNHFKLLALMYKELERRYGIETTDKIMEEVVLEGGDVYFEGFTRLDPDENLLDFIKIYKLFERRNIVFNVVEENERHFEIVINRCLVFECFNELDVPGLTKWMCDIAFNYFNHYHPKIKYEKDCMIARGDKTCHEIFSWNE
jgi:hypothetical protein